MTSDVTAWAEKLDAMTADDIANLLGEEGVTGAHTATDWCPIAVFLRSKGNVQDIMVVGGLVQWCELVVNNGIPDVEYHRVFTPNGIREFVIRFDNGAFPELHQPRSSVPPAPSLSWVHEIASYPTVPTHA